LAIENMLIDQINSDLRQAQLARDEVKVSTLRLLLSEIKNAQIIKGEALSDKEIVSVMQKEVKKRKEASVGFRKGSREDQALAEEAEAQILSFYLPAQMKIEELTKLIEDTINELGAKSISEMGTVIGKVMAKVAGRADGSQVSQIVKEKLS
jgi:uncharacterized protein